jgi:hypothetical protein
MTEKLVLIISQSTRITVNVQFSLSAVYEMIRDRTII